MVFRQDFDENGFDDVHRVSDRLGCFGIAA